MQKNIGIIVGIIVVAGIGFFAFSGDKTEPVENQKTKQVATEKDDSMTEEKEFEAVIAKAKSITLPDVSKSGASGTAWLAVYNGKTYHRVVAKNMPALPGTDFYEGWLVKNPVPGGFVSSGKMKYNPATKEATLDFVIDGDKSDYRFIVITSEPDDNNPAPDKHIIEDRFAASVDLNVVLDTMKEKSSSETMMKVGSYEAYSPEKIARAETGNVVLFFHASWCPSCKALSSDIEKNVSAIPASVTVLKADYDKETELKKKYGVTTQHTLVQVDKDGNLIKKWSGGSKLSNLLEEIQ